MSYRYHSSHRDETNSHRKRRSRSGDRPAEKYSRLDTGAGASSFERMARSVLAGTLVEPGSSYQGFDRPLPPAPAPPQMLFGETNQNSSKLYEKNHSTSLSSDNHTKGVVPADDRSSFIPARTARLQNNLLEHFHRNLSETVAKAQSELSASDENPSRILCLERFVSKKELFSIYHKAYVLPCNHSSCKKSSCFYLPVIKDPTLAGQSVIEFSSETKAAIFKQVLRGFGIQSHFVPGPKYCQYNGHTSLMVKEEFKTGIPKRTFRESYCVCAVLLHNVSSASVEDGIVSAPIKISIYTGWPQKWSLLFLELLI